MTSKTVHTTATIIPYQTVLPEEYVCADPDGRPDSLLQSQSIAECDHLLRYHYSGRSDVLVDSGGFVFYNPADLHNMVRPDLYIAFSVDVEAIRRRRGYVVWEVGKPPDFALEVASESTHHEDTDIKPSLYSRIGISEYWRFDPMGGEWYGYPLAGDILVDGVYQPIPINTDADGISWGYSPALDLSLCAFFPLWGDRLRFYDSKIVRYLRNIGEVSAAEEQERADHRATQAELERLRAEIRRLQGR